MTIPYIKMQPVDLRHHLDMLYQEKDDAIQYRKSVIEIDAKLNELRKVINARYQAWLKAQVPSEWILQQNVKSL